VYRSGKFGVAGLQNRFFTSTDGSGWTEGTGSNIYAKDAKVLANGTLFNPGGYQTIGGEMQIPRQAVLFQGAFIIAAYSGIHRFETSPARLSKVVNTQNMYAVAVLNDNMCVAVGENGKVFVSPNGTAWAEYTATGNPLLKTICAKN
jgi:hypothetical protein